MRPFHHASAGGSQTTSTIVTGLPGWDQSPAKASRVVPAPEASTRPPAAERSRRVGDGGDKDGGGASGLQHDPELELVGELLVSVTDRDLGDPGDLRTWRWVPALPAWTLAM